MNELAGTWPYRDMTHLLHRDVVETEANPQTWKSALLELSYHVPFLTDENAYQYWVRVVTAYGLVSYMENGALLTAIDDLTLEYSLARSVDINRFSD